MTYVIIGLGIIITIVPFFKIYKNRKFNLQNLFIIICGLVLLVLSFIKNYRDNKQEERQNAIVVKLGINTDSLNIQLQEMIKYRIADSAKNAEFLIKLEKNFKIGRDSIYNKPIQINTFNTKIRDVESLQIGPR